MKLAAVLFACCVATVAAGCGSTHRSTFSGRSQSRAASFDRTAPTHLTVVANGPPPAHRVWHLSCTPPSGDVPQPAQACAAIAAEPTLITKPRWSPRWDSCLGGVNLSIAGRLNGKPVHTEIGTCMTRHTPLVNKLGLAAARR